WEFHRLSQSAASFQKSQCFWCNQVLTDLDGHGCQLPPEQRAEATLGDLVSESTKRALDDGVLSKRPTWPKISGIGMVSGTDAIDCSSLGCCERMRHQWITFAEYKKTVFQKQIPVLREAEVWDTDACRKDRDRQ